MLKKSTPPRLPFAVNRALRTELETQVTDGIRQAIRSGFYKSGELLPSVLEFAHGLGVSIRAPMAAFKTLTQEGLISPRRRTGTVVLDTGRRTFFGHVIIVQPDYEPVYYKTVLELRLAERFLKAGYLTTRLALRRVDEQTQRFDVSPLDCILDRTISLVILLGSRPHIERVLSKSGVPYVVVGKIQTRRTGLAGFVHFDINASLPEIVAHLKRAGVRRLVQVAKRSSELLSTDQLASAVAHVETLTIPLLKSETGPDGAVRPVMNEFLHRYRKADDLPDAFLFTDDYIARGGLLALAINGLRIPESVKVVTLANAGLGPVLPIPLARFEMNAGQDADKISEAVLTLLRSGKFPSGVRIYPTYFPGETL